MMANLGVRTPVKKPPPAGDNTPAVHDEKPSLPASLKRPCKPAVKTTKRLKEDALRMELMEEQLLYYKRLNRVTGGH